MKWLLIPGVLALSLSAMGQSLFSSTPAVITSSTLRLVNLVGTGTSWTTGTPGSPTFTVSGVAGVSITAQTVSSTTTAQITLTTGSTSGTLTITDPSTSQTTTIQVRAPVTHYVRSDGGTPTQCTGLVDAAYSGSGSAQPCALQDIRYWWTSGAFCNNSSASTTCWFWNGAGGDTWKFRDSIQYTTSSPFPSIPGSSGPGWIGQQGPGTSDWGISLAGDPNNSGWPFPPNGTPTHHTVIEGYNASSCSAKDANGRLTQAALVYGAYAVGEMGKMEGSSYLDVACLRFSDQSSCGRSAQVNTCSTTPGALSNFAGSGFGWSNKSTNDTMTDIQVDGMASIGMGGPTGDGVVMTDVLLLGNAGAGWNMDHGDGTTGTGSLIVNGYTIEGSGCAEEFPIVHALPYQDCTDDNVGGYGDGIGTATVPSNPVWHVQLNNGTVRYNTQDGDDGLHINGCTSPGVCSTLVVTRTLAYGSEGNQIKIGNAGSLINDVINDNCEAMSGPITGFPPILTYSLLTYTITQPGGPGTISSVTWTTPTQSPLLAAPEYLHTSSFGTSTFFNNVSWTIDSATATSVTAHNNAFTHLPVGPVTEAGTGTQGWNSGLSDFCRAGTSPWVIGVEDGPNALVIGNTIYSSKNASGGDMGTIALEGTCTTCGVTFIDNTQYGQTTGNGLPDRFSDGSGVGGGIFSQAASVISNNVCFGANGSGCTITGETNSIFVLPQLVDTTWNATGFNNVAPSSGSSNVVAAGIANANRTIDFNGVLLTNPPVVGAIQFSGSTTVATPTASPGAGTYSSTQSVSLSTATGGATICYTTDGTTPTATTPGTCSHGTTYSTAITVSTTTTIEALGTLSGSTNSGVLTALYTITPAAPSNLRIQGIPTMRGIIIQ